MLKLFMSRQRLYWTCQFTGWTAYQGYEVFYSAVQTNRWHVLVVFNAMVNVCLGVFITHVYRLLIKKLNWLELPVYRLLPRILLSICLMATMMTGINIPLDLLTLEDITLQSFTLPVILLGIFNWIRHFLLWTAIYHTIQYFERLKNNEVEKIRLASANRDFEVKLLRSQLNPHFVFNALNSIRALVIENPHKAQQSITQLSRILRNSLLAERHRTVSLAEELQTVKDYLELEKIRYEERLAIQTDISPEAMQVQVPPMMVQTLVENAIKHGVSKPINGGFVAIEARQEKGHLLLVIRNTGKLERDQSSEGTGFGLSSTRQRLDLIYGENKASFHIRQESEEVVCAQLVIPA
jgi:two-component system LytT family sensor kinase